MNIDSKCNNEIMVVCDSKEYDSEHMLQITSKAKSLANECGKKVSVLCIGEKKTANMIGLCYMGQIQCLPVWSMSQLGKAGFRILQQQ